ncbi:hypothetical protein SJAV_11440 [Sulfurisphaera javensis]|uniref:PIN domain-containing protein n=1 Tax=Sulfurisphaera javensis TaxID=2049879 RepID=A0AAT9GQZ1_9CREN
MKLLVETSALIEYLRRNEKIKEIVEEADEIYISSLSVFELLSGRVKEDVIIGFYKAV